MKGFFKKKVVRVITVIIVIALIVSGALFFIARNKAKNNATKEFTYVRTVSLSYGSLNETIVASGTIESQNTSTITSSVNGATISKINYSVGDYVEEGDIIVELDTTNISKQITKEKENISSQQERLQDSYNNAYSSYSSAYSDYESAKSAYDAYEAEYQSKLKSIASYQSTYDNVKSALDDYVNTYIVSNDVSSIDSDQTYIDLKQQTNAAEQALNQAKNLIGYNNEFVNSYNQAKNAYTSADSKLSNAKSSLSNAEENLNDGVDSDNLDSLYDTYSDYKIKAKSSGQITNINAVVGSNTNGTLATIQDTSKLKISLTIDEYDILKLELGMKCIIETDASDKTYEGEVSVISPVASNSMGSSGFEIEVNVTSEDVKDLLIGMNAEVTIILSSTQENFTVPMDAVETRNNETSVIYVEDENGEFYEVEVTTGSNNGYYVEIFGDNLTVGMKVRASADAKEAEVTITEDQMSEDSFNFFSGIFGGGGNTPSGNGPDMNNMPSGGGNMPSGGGGNMPSGGGNMPSGGNAGGFNGN